MSMFLAKISGWLRENKGWILIIFSVLFLMVMSFFFGYFSGRINNPAPIIIEKHTT